MDEDPFPDLEIANADFLDSLGGREKCPRCQKSRKYFCYSCYVPVEGTEGRIPKIKLPVQIDIIKHPQELDGKSTSAHAAVIAPDDVHVYTYPIIPEYEDKTKVLLIYPGDDSLTMEQYVQKYSRLVTISSTESFRTASNNTLSANGDTASTEKNIENGQSASNSSTHTPETGSDSGHDIVGHNQSSINSGINPNSSCLVEGPQASGVTQDDVYKREPDGVPCGECKKQKLDVYEKTFDRIVFIDSTWHQVRRIYMDERLAGLQKIELKTQTTKFWRYKQDKPLTYLSTIEAVYYYLREYHELFEMAPYSGQYDNLLFFFKYMYQKIRGACGGEIDGSKLVRAYRPKQKK